MSKRHVTMITIAVSLAFFATAYAETMTKEQHKTASDRISADHKASAAACGALTYRCVAHPTTAPRMLPGSMISR